jgi:hypothetical protein
MAVELAEQVFSRKKHTTIRLDREALEYPASLDMPLFGVEQGQRHSEARPLGEVRISAVDYKPVTELNDRDAQDDGFDSRSALLAALEEFYGHIQPWNLVCIYRFESARRLQAAE